MNRINRLLSALIMGFAQVAALGLLLLALCVSVDVAMRFATGRPITGVFEFAGVILVGVTFLPLGAVLLTNQQLRVDIVLETLRGRALATFMLLDVATGLLVFGLLVSIATEEALKAYHGRFLLRGLIEIPTWIPNAMIWVGTVLSLVALALRGIDALRRLAGLAPLTFPRTAQDDGDR